MGTGFDNVESAAADDRVVIIGLNDVLVTAADELENRAGPDAVKISAGYGRLLCIRPDGINRATSDKRPGGIGVDYILYAAGNGGVLGIGFDNVGRTATNRRAVNCETIPIVGVALDDVGIPAADGGDEGKGLNLI